MATIRVSVVGTEELKRKLAKLNPGKNRDIMRKSLSDMAQLIQSDAALNQIRRGARHAPPIPDRLTSRHEGTGLVGSIRINSGPLPHAIEVGSDKLYAPLHEFGLGRMPKRSFLQPALDKVGPKFGSIIVKHWRREAGV